MTETSGSRPLEAWLAAAYAPGETACPPPEAYLADELADLAPADRERLLAHAAACPACAAERELAARFDAAPAGVEPEKVAFVVSRLRRQGARVLPFAPQKAGRPFSLPLSRLAAAAVLVLAAGLGALYLRPAPPSLPAPRDGALRGAAITGLAPRGELAERPAALRWEPRAGVAAYRVRIYTVDEEVLWEATVEAPPAPLPATAAARLEGGVSYTWTVEGLDARGRGIARSERAALHLRPGL